MRVAEAAYDAIAGLVAFVVLMVAQGPDWRWIAGIGGTLILFFGGWAVSEHIAREAERDQKQSAEIVAAQNDIKQLTIQFARVGVVEAKIDSLREDTQELKAMMQKAFGQ